MKEIISKEETLEFLEYLIGRKKYIFSKSKWKLLDETIEKCSTALEAYEYFGSKAKETEYEFNGILYREDLYDYLIAKDYSKDDAFAIMEIIGKGNVRYTYTSYIDYRLSEWAKCVDYLPSRSIFMKNFYKEYDSYLKKKNLNKNIIENDILELIKNLIKCSRGDKWSPVRILIRNRFFNKENENFYIYDTRHLLEDALKMVSFCDRGYYETKSTREFFENVRHKKDVYFDDHYLKGVPYACKTDNFELTVRRRNMNRSERVKFMKGDKIFFDEAFRIEYVIPIPEIIEQLLKIDIYKKDDSEIVEIIKKVQPIMMSVKEHEILRKGTKKTDSFLDAYRKNHDKVKSKIVFMDFLGREVDFDNDYDFFKKIEFRY